MWSANDVIYLNAISKNLENYHVNRNNSKMFQNIAQFCNYFAQIERIVDRNFVLKIASDFESYSAIAGAACFFSQARPF